MKTNLLLRVKKSVILPSNLEGLIKSRIKQMSKNMDLSLIFAYSTILGSRIEFDTLALLGIKDVDKHAQTIAKTGLGRVENGVIYLNNFLLFFL